MAGGAGRRSPRRLHAQHFRHLFQDSHCPRRRSRHSSLRRPCQTPRPPHWYRSLHPSLFALT